ncbi:hypothetical protein C8R44DRAFT_729426 [Mycena epipterygia]|nr:hypothetical protein C8R44DRAFT_729426 [Mycena epipterygia]
MPAMAEIADPVGVVQCLPYTFTWTGGVPPYDVGVYGAFSGGTPLFSAVTNDTNVTWTPVDGVGATADLPVDFNVVIRDDSLYSNSNSASENITAGSIAVDSTGLNSTSSVLTASMLTAPISASGSNTFIPTTIQGVSKSASGATNSAADSTILPAATTTSNGGAPSAHPTRMSILLGIVFGGIMLAL